MEQVVLVCQIYVLDCGARFIDRSIEVKGVP